MDLEELWGGMGCQHKEAVEFSPRCKIETPFAKQAWWGACESLGPCAEVRMMLCKAPGVSRWLCLVWRLCQLQAWSLRGYRQGRQPSLGRRWDELIPVILGFEG